MAEGGRQPQDNSLGRGMFQSKLIHCCVTSTHVYTYYFVMLDSCHIPGSYISFFGMEINKGFLMTASTGASGVAESDCSLPHRRRNQGGTGACAHPSFINCYINWSLLYM